MGHERVNEPSADEGVWVIIGNGNRTRVARLKDYKEFNEDTRKNVYGVLKNNSGLVADLVLDYFSPITRVPVLAQNGQMQPDPRNPNQPLMGIGREEITTNYENIVEPTPVAFFNVSDIVFLDEVPKFSQNRMKEVITQTLDHLKE